MRINSRLIRQILLRVVVYTGVVAVTAAAYYFLGPLIVRLAHPVSPLPPVSEGIRNRILIVGPNGRLFLCNDRGKDMVALTDASLQCREPAWSFDGRYVAFIALRADGEEGVYGVAATGGTPACLVPPLENFPIYINWSPDNRSIACLSRSGGPMTLSLIDTQNPRHETKLGEGLQVFWDWSPDSARVLWHRENQILVAQRDNGNQKAIGQGEATEFSSPAWTQEGMIFATKDGDDQVLALAPSDIGKRKTLTTFEGTCRFAVSPSGEYVACIFTNTRHRIWERSHTTLLNVVTGESREIAGPWVVALWWSPNGHKVALLTKRASKDTSHGEEPEDLVSIYSRDDKDSRYLWRWWIYDVESDTLTPLVSFRPTESLEKLIPYFTQYDTSQTYWSPDSRYLLVSAKDRRGSGATVWVVDTLGQEEPRDLGPGELAVWSWQ